MNEDIKNGGEKTENTTTSSAKTALPPQTANGDSKTYIPSDETNYSSSQKGVVALGIYLLFIIVFSVLAMAVILMGKPVCDSPECQNEANSSTANSNTDTANQNTYRNSNQNTNSAVNSNSNSNSNGNTSGATNANSPTPTATPSVSPTKSPTTTTTTTATPTKTPTPEKSQNLIEPTIPKEIEVKYLGIISANSYLFLIVLFAGMLGGVLRGIYSFVKHLGLGDFSFNWTWFYLTLPFTGAVLSLIMYFVIRGGFYETAYGKGLNLNLFAFAAVAILTGLFTDNAMEKLKQVAVTLLADVPPKVQNAKEIVDKKNEERK